MNEIYLTPQMVSEILHLGMNQIYKLFQSKGFPSIKIGKKWIVKQDDLYKFLDERKRTEIVL